MKKKTIVEKQTVENLPDIRLRFTPTAQFNRGNLATLYSLFLVKDANVWISYLVKFTSYALPINSNFTVVLELYSFALALFCFWKWGIYEMSFTFI